MRKYKTLIAGWNNYPVTTSYLVRPERFSDLKIDSSSMIPRGLGRSYGDAAINTNHTVVLMERLNRMRSFDEESGVLRVESGVSLEEILHFFVPRGWFLPVTPGTKFTTIGGCVAADVHGKNHHLDGTFGKYVQALELMLPDSSLRRCTPKQDSELFWATVGGMGLTGIITEVTLQLVPIESAYMSVKHHSANDLDQALELLSATIYDDKYSVAWIDCLTRGKNFGRSIIMNGHHATLQELPIRIKDPLAIKTRKSIEFPFNCPSWMMNPYSIKAFNVCYYHFQSKKIEPFIVDYDRYFYPLDAILKWNRLYGKKGFVQYQFVVPTQNGREALMVILDELTRSKRASFLAVLKRFGKEGEGLLSFPKGGYTLALDIPFSDPNLLPFLDHLDEIVLKFDGRVYLAKDARLSSATFRKMYPRFSQWQRIKGAIDPHHIFSSDLSRRLEMEKA